MSAAHTYAKDNRAQFKADYLDLLKIPSISTDPTFTSEVRRAADWIATKMQSFGMSAELISMPEGRHPMVLGTWDGAGTDAKTVLIYCHYDVQPALKSDGWETEPFEPTELDGKVFARGATDSKVHVIAQMKAVESLIKTNTCPVNIKLAFEGEEESGGETILAATKQYPDKFRADIAVISDGIIRSPEQPAIVYGLRGICTMELWLQGPVRDLHSGHFGGTVHNPAQVISEIIAKLHNDDGSVAVPHFYDDVLSVDDTERELLMASEASLNEEWVVVAGAPQQWGEFGYTLHERIGARPTLEINGITSGYTGDGFKTVLPQLAMAKISCRLVPNQDALTIVTLVQDYIRSIAPPTVTVDFKHIDANAPGIVLDIQGNAIQAAYRAYHQGWGVKPVYERAGGSVPITYTMMNVADDVTIMGFSYKGGRAHGQNENIYLDMFYKGIDTAIYFLQEIGNA